MRVKRLVKYYPLPFIIIIIILQVKIIEKIIKKKKKSGPSMKVITEKKKVKGHHHITLYIIDVLHKIEMFLSIFYILTNVFEYGINNHMREEKNKTI